MVKCLALAHVPFVADNVGFRVDACNVLLHLFKLRLSVAADKQAKSFTCQIVHCVLSQYSTLKVYVVPDSVELRRHAVRHAGLPVPGAPVCCTVACCLYNCRLCLLCCMRFCAMSNASLHRSIFPLMYMYAFLFKSLLSGVLPMVLASYLCRCHTKQSSVVPAV